MLAHIAQHTGIEEENGCHQEEEAEEEAEEAEEVGEAEEEAEAEDKEEDGRCLHILGPPAHTRSTRLNRPASGSNATCALLHAFFQLPCHILGLPALPVYCAISIGTLQVLLLGCCACARSNCRLACAAVINNVARCCCLLQMACTTCMRT